MSHATPNAARTPPNDLQIRRLRPQEAKISPQKALARPLDRPEISNAIALMAAEWKPDRLESAITPGAEGKLMGGGYAESASVSIKPRKAAS